MCTENVFDYYIGSQPNSIYEVIGSVGLKTNLYIITHFQYLTDKFSKIVLQFQAHHGLQ